MKLAIILSSFPTVSETFILSQITGLIDLGVGIDIFANHKSDLDKVHEDVEKYSLTNNCYYLRSSRSKIKRLMNAIYLFLRYLKNTPLLIRSLNFMKYGRISLNLSLFYHTLQFLSNDKYEYDIILCHFGPIGDLAVKLREISAIKGKVVTVFHGSDITRLIIENGKDYYNDLFEKGDLFLPISENFANKLKQLGCPKEKIIVHRMAINIDKFIYRLPLYTDDKPLKIISVARLVEKKGIEFSVEAVIAALEENVNIEYKIIGDGPLKDKIFKLIEIHGFKDKIRLLGWKNQEEIVDILNNEADLFLVPSVTAVNGDQEGLPVVIMEALAIGLPVIATNHSGIPEIIENNVTGYIVPERDVKALKDMITKVQNDYSFVRAMTLNGRNLVEKEYNIKLQNERLKNIFEDLLSV